MTTPILAGLAVGASAYAAKFALEAAVKFRTAGPRLRPFYKGGFQEQMTRREAALILGVREYAKEEAIKDAHRKIMIANHPDAGGGNPEAFKPCTLLAGVASVSSMTRSATLLKESQVKVGLFALRQLERRLAKAMNTQLHER